MLSVKLCGPQGGTGLPVRGFGDVRLPDTNESLENFKMSKKSKNSIKNDNSSIRIASVQVNKLFQQGHALQQQGQFAQAEGIYREILEIQPRHFDALHMLGILCAQSSRLNDAENYILQAVEMDSRNAAAFNNLGNVYQYLSQYSKAVESFKKAIELKPDHVHAHFNAGNAMTMMGAFEEALESYDQSLLLAPNFVEAFVRRGDVLRSMNQLDAAIQSYERAIALRSNDPVLLNALGAAYLDVFQPDKAEKYLSQAIELEPAYVAAIFNRGNAFELLKNFDLALIDYNEVKILKPEYDYLSGIIFFAKLNNCDWSDYFSNLSAFDDQVRKGLRCSTPFPSIAISNSLEIQRKIAELYVESSFEKKRDHEFPINPHSIEKIRVGYYSSDFRDHPLSYLIAELFESHHRENFEIYAFSFGSAVDAMQKRIASGVDHFIDASQMSDAEVVAVSRKLNIDIAVDLGGYTQNSRTDVFSLRAAPIQVNYLGYAGTMAAKFIDYMIADEVLIPKESVTGYSEKIIYLPGSFMVNDRQREISHQNIQRSQCQLPDDGFVFCCFNNSYKITPPVFDVWMKLLRRVPGSVLWLKAEHSVVVSNLRKEANVRGVDGERLIFAGRVPLLSHHLARHRLADLFLDTLPYNAHTTASDALWAGLPVLTCVGETFASRVAASLLNAIRLPELITHSLAEYEELAFALATSPDRLRQVKETLAKNRLTTPLFDTPLFTENIEKAYRKIHERRIQGFPPEHISLTSLAL